MKVHYWECLTHKCGSSKFNTLGRHAWSVCDIKKSYGKLEKNTWNDKQFGGLNGDLSRKFYKDWDKLCLILEQKEQLKLNWVRQFELHEANVDASTRRRY